MPTLVELQEQRAKHVHDAREILNRAEKENRDLTAEEQRQYAAIDAQIDGIDSQVQRQELKNVKRPVPPTRPQGGDGSSLTIDYPAGLHIPALLKGRQPRQNVITAGSGDAWLRSQPRYREQFLNYLQTGREQLGLKVSKNDKGGYLTTTQFIAELLKAIDDQVMIRQLARVLPPLGSAISLGVPTRDSRLNSADWTAEIPASDIAEDDSLTLGKRELMPHLLTKLVKASLKMLRSGVISIEQFIREEMAYVFGTTLENAYLTGDGAQQPLGIFVASTDGISTTRDVTASSATAFTADNLIDCLYNLKAQYQGNATWFMHRDFVSRARKLKDGNGQYLWQPGLAGQPSTILDRPYFMSEFAPNTFTASQYVAVVGDFMAGYWIVDSLGLEIQVLMELFRLRNQVGYIGHLESDGAPVLEEAFSRLKLSA